MHVWVSWYESEKKATRKRVSHAIFTLQMITIFKWFFPKLATEVKPEITAIEAATYKQEIAHSWNTPHDPHSHKRVMKISLVFKCFQWNRKTRPERYCHCNISETWNFVTMKLNTFDNNGKVLLNTHLELPRWFKQPRTS